jgi:hypothetical protein
MDYLDILHFGHDVITHLDSQERYIVGGVNLYTFTGEPNRTIQHSAEHSIVRFDTALVSDQPFPSIQITCQCNRNFILHSSEQCELQIVYDVFSGPKRNISYFLDQVWNNCENGHQRVIEYDSQRYSYSGNSQIDFLRVREAHEPLRLGNSRPKTKPKSEPKSESEVKPNLDGIKSTIDFLDFS